jgi:hypothetical protein
MQQPKVKNWFGTPEYVRITIIEEELEIQLGCLGRDGEVDKIKEILKLNDDFSGEMYKLWKGFNNEVDRISKKETTNG